MDVILSIKPKYCDEIIKGTKRYEFRRTSFSRNTRLVYMYSTAPVGKIIGTFEVKRIVEDIPKMLWKRFRDSAGIGEKEFFDYFEGAQTGFAIEIRNVQAVKPFDPQSLIPDFQPPQSYVYLLKKEKESVKLLDFITVDPCENNSTRAQNNNICKKGYPETQSPRKYDYDAFISYNKADKDFAEKLVNRIEKETTDGEPIKIFFAEWDIEYGENILLKIEKAEPSSHFIIPIMSPDWLTSDWTTLERVIPVYEDPAGLKGRILPIMRRSCEPPPSMRILRWFNFETDSNFERECKKLIGRIQGKTLRETLGRDSRPSIHTGQIEYDSLTADVQEEEIPSNLFTLVKIPASLNVALSTVKLRKDVWPILGEGANPPPFAFDEDKHQIYSFASLRDRQYRFGELFLEPTCKAVSTTSMISGNDSRWIIDLLNRAMTKHMREDLHMAYDYKGTKKTFFPLEKAGDETIYVKWKVGNKEHKRFLVKKAPLAVPYYVHRSCKATFTQMGERLFLKVLPGWHFTKDGIEEPVPSLQMASLSSRWMNAQRNHSVLDDVRFWIYMLSEGTDEICLTLGNDLHAVIATVPAIANNNRGIEGDYKKRMWNEQPEADYFDEEMERSLEIDKVFSVDEL